jgi:hypothetical protein
MEAPVGIDNGADQPAPRGGTDRHGRWGVLAVALALMALVAAVSNRSQGARSLGAHEPTAAFVRPSSGAAATPSGTLIPTTDPTSGEGAIPGVTTGPAMPGMGTSADKSDGTVPTPPVSPPSTPPVSPTTTTLPLTSFVGYLQAPDNVSALYPVSASGGQMVTQATLPADAQVTVTLRCGSAIRSATGTSGVAVALSAPAGACAATIALPDPATTQGGAIPYTLVITGGTG